MSEQPISQELIPVYFEDKASMSVTVSQLEPVRQLETFSTEKVNDACDSADNSPDQYQPENVSLPLDGSDALNDVVVFAQAQELSDESTNLSQNDRYKPSRPRHARKFFRDIGCDQHDDKNVSATKVVVVDLCAESSHDMSPQNSPKSDEIFDLDSSTVTSQPSCDDPSKSGGGAFIEKIHSSPVVNLSDIIDDDRSGIDDKSSHRIERRKRRRVSESEVVILDDDVPSFEDRSDPADDMGGRSQVASTVIRPFSCPICLEDVPRGAQACILGCGHRMCFNCAEEFVCHKVQDAQVRRLCVHVWCVRGLCVVMRTCTVDCAAQGGFGLTYPGRRSHQSNCAARCPSARGR